MFGAQVPSFQSNIGFGSTGTFASPQPTPLPTVTSNPNKDLEIPQPPDDTVTALRFISPGGMGSQLNYMLASSWDQTVRIWELQSTGNCVPKAMQKLDAPVLSACWSDDGTKIFTAGCDKTSRMWDLTSNQMIQVAQHDAPIKTIHYIKAPNYTSLLTGSWDKTLKLWDMRSPNPMLTLQLPERCYCADAVYPVAVVGTANRNIVLFSLEGTPREVRKVECTLKYQLRTVSIFYDKTSSLNPPAGFAIGSIEGRVSINVLNTNLPKDNFTFKCHRSTETVNGVQEIYPVNDISFHPIHNTLATVGSDGRYNFWDKDSRTKLKSSEIASTPSEVMPITCCAFNPSGHIFAYSTGYDWSKGHEFNRPDKKPAIYMHPAFEELKPRKK
ncbi:unnamed protein product [Gordionus sp. m RMFG-2023]|uniref:protein Rae1-like n=1 Tax=Gordionus sp. m RMFG-2023 TaxID=3053472 RepID=UPI0030DEF474